ncbi:MAG TPA: hypothetical protein VMS56_12255 [Thermoanaerobaculia bacterium]|nr:hypothetical protein [Thermoanaerobaculia bacterium]
MTATIRIRPAESGDAATLAALYGQLDSEREGPAPGTIRALLDRLREYPSYRVYLAFRGERAAGSFALLIMETLGSRCRPAAVVRP